MSMDKLNYHFEPSSVSFSGYVDLIQEGNDLLIEAKGNICYHSYRTYFARKTYLAFYPYNGGEIK